MLLIHQIWQISSFQTFLLYNMIYSFVKLENLPSTLNLHTNEMIKFTPT